VYIKASLKRGEPLDHVLLSGPSGFGKATLAHVIANELGSQLRLTSAPEIKKTGDLAALITNLQEGDVLVIDEIHRLLPALEEKLYPAMEDFSLDLLIGLGPGARSIKVELPKFTLIGTTEQVGLMRQRFMKCFGISFRLRLYETEELQVLIEQMCDELGAVIDGGAANIIARRAQGSPTAAKSVLRRIRDYAEVEFDGRITKEVVSEALGHMTGAD
jgi:Holliday junction DNA helicase RuvB